MTQNVIFPESTEFDFAGLRRRRRDLADYIEEIAEQPLIFRDTAAIMHSAANHRHLWMIERLADQEHWIDLAFRVGATGHILGRWRDRLPSYAPTRSQGFRLYLYADVAPTVSVVAETAQGCPYGGNLTFVPRIADVLAPFAGRSWMAAFSRSGPMPEQILSAADKAEGSLRATALALRLPLAQYRRVVETYGLAREVNSVRKRYGRRPARFADPDAALPDIRLWEWRMAPSG